MHVTHIGKLVVMMAELPYFTLGSDEMTTPVM